MTDFNPDAFLAKLDQGQAPAPQAQPNPQPSSPAAAFNPDEFMQKLDKKPEEPVGSESNPDSKSIFTDEERYHSSFGNLKGVSKLLKGKGFSDVKENKNGDVVAKDADGKWYKDESNFFGPSAPQGGLANLASRVVGGHPLNWMESHAGGALPVVAGTAGGAAGFVGGTLGTGAGSIPAALVGAGAGGTAGELARQAKGKEFGTYEGDAGDQALDAGKAGAEMAAAELGGHVIAGVAKAARPYLQTAENALQPLVEPIKKFAYEKATKSFGPFKKEMRKLLRYDQAEDVGKAALENGIIGFRPVSQETLAGRAEQAAGETGQAIGKRIEDLQGTGESLANPPGDYGAILPQGAVPPGQGKFGLNRKAIADDMYDQLKYSEELEHLRPGMNQKIRQQLSAWAEKDGGMISMPEAQKLKTDISRKGLANWKKLDNPSEDEMFWRAMDQSLKKASEETETALEKAVISQQGQGQAVLPDLRSDYGAFKNMQNMANERALAERVNRSVSPSDYGVGGLTAAAAHAGGSSPSVSGLTGAAAGLVNQVGRRFGNQMMAKGAYTVAKPVSALYGSPLMNAISKNPSILDTLTNEGLKKLLRSRIDEDSGIGNDAVVSPDQAKRLFKDGS